MGVAAAGVAVTALGDAALLDVAVSGALLAGAAAFMPGSATSKALQSKGAQCDLPNTHGIASNCEHCLPSKCVMEVGVGRCTYVSLKITQCLAQQQEGSMR